MSLHAPFGLLSSCLGEGERVENEDTHSSRFLPRIALPARHSLACLRARSCCINERASCDGSETSS